MGLFVPAGASLGQQASQSLYYNLFGPDSVELLPGAADRLATAARRAKPAPGECPKGRIRVFAAEGDPLFQKALAYARRDALLRELAARGIDVSRFVVEAQVSDSAHDVQLDYGSPSDRTPPTLEASWRPENGSRVRPGQEIRVTMTARDDTSDWQTGIRTIQLLADSEGNRIVNEMAYPPHLPTCEGQPPPRTLEAVYTVPPSPPPIVRLRARTRDHTGRTEHEVVATAAFPTGDWYGTLTYSGGQPPHQHTARADLVLNHDGRGNLTGTMVGETRWIDASTVPGCFTSMRRPHRFRVALTGAYTEGRSIKVFVGDIEDSPMVLNNRCPTYNITDEVKHLGFRNYLGLGWSAQQPFLGTPSPLGDGEVLADGSRSYRWEATSMVMTVSLRAARN
jgi:hypothetical protein